MPSSLSTLADVRAFLINEGHIRAASLIPRKLEKGLPQQTFYLGRRVRVRLGGDPSDLFGVIVRDDLSPPEMMIIRLDDGRHVLQVECEETEPWA